MNIRKILIKLYSAFYCLIHCNKGLLKNRSQIKYSGAYLSHCKFEVSGKGNNVIIGSKTRLENCNIVIHGNNCQIRIDGGQGSRLSNMTLWCEDDGSSIEIGNHPWMEGGHIASTEGCKIIIGDDFLSSHDLEIRNGDSHAIINATDGKRINQAQDIVIGNHVWVAANVTMLKGSKIPAHCVVATGAIVTQSFEQGNCIYGGVPAKKLKQSVDWISDRNM